MRRDDAGKHFVSIYVGHGTRGRSNPQSCAGQAIVAIAGGVRRARGERATRTEGETRRPLKGPCDGQTVAGARVCEVHDVNMHSGARTHRGSQWMLR